MTALGDFTADLLKLHLAKKPTEVLKQDALRLDSGKFLQLTEEYAGTYGTLFASVRNIKRRSAIDIDRSIIRSGDRWLVDLRNNIIYDLEKKTSTTQITLDGNVIPMESLNLNFTFDNKYIIYNYLEEVYAHPISDLPINLNRFDRLINVADGPIINIEGKYFGFQFFTSFRIEYYDGNSFTSIKSIGLGSTIHVLYSKLKSWPPNIDVIKLLGIIQRHIQPFKSIDQLQFSPDNKWLFLAYTGSDGKFYIAN